MRAWILTLLIAGFCLTSCGRDASVQLAGTVTTEAVAGGCAAETLQVEPDGGEIIAVELEPGRAAVPVGCLYSFAVTVDRADQYRFTLTGADFAILQLVEGQALDHLHLDFRQVQLDPRQ